MRRSGRGKVEGQTMSGLVGKIKMTSIKVSPCAPCCLPPSLQGFTGTKFCARLLYLLLSLLRFIRAFLNTRDSISRSKEAYLGTRTHSNHPEAACDCPAQSFLRRYSAGRTEPRTVSCNHRHRLQLMYNHFSPLHLKDTGSSACKWRTSCK